MQAEKGAASMSEDTPLLVLVGIAAELIPDVATAEMNAIGADDHILRRNFVRAAFALVEGLNYARRHLAEKSPHLPEQARAKAREAALAEKVIANEKDRSGVAKSLRVSFAAFAAAEEVDNPVDATGSEWANFLNAVRIRNRITHPLRGLDCRISEDEFRLVRDALRWYQDVDSLAMSAARKRRET